MQEARSLLEQENEILRRAAVYLGRGPPKMMYPLVSDLADEGIPVARDLSGARILQAGLFQVAGQTRL